MGALLHALGAFRGRPPYGASIFFEAREDDSIRIFYLNDTYSEAPTAILPPGCDAVERCSQRAFFAAMEGLMPEDWRAECDVA